MKSHWWFFCTLCLASCMVSNGLQYEAMSETNLYHIAKLRKGMSESQVLQIMKKPYSYESFQVEDDLYDVWFYVTRPTGLDQTRMVPQNLTPLTFKNGVLVGTGYNWYYYAMKEEMAETAPQKGPNEEQKQEKEGEGEDQELEGTLKRTQTPSFSQSPAAPSNGPIASETGGSVQNQPPTKRSMFKPYVPQTPLSVSQKTFSKTRRGMSQEKVMDLIGSTADHERFSLGGDLYEVWFYEVTAKNPNKPSKKIPLTFKNGKLVGLSQIEYDKIKQQAASQSDLQKRDSFRGYTKDADRGQEEESEQNFNYW